MKMHADRRAAIVVTHRAFNRSSTMYFDDNLRYTTHSNLNLDKLIPPLMDGILFLFDGRLLCRYLAEINTALRIQVAIEICEGIVRASRDGFHPELTVKAGVD